MTFRATRVKLHNETQHTLELKDSTAVGEWTEKWAPPATGPPFTCPAAVSLSSPIIGSTTF